MLQWQGEWHQSNFQRAGRRWALRLSAPECVRPCVWCALAARVRSYAHSGVEAQAEEEHDSDDRQHEAGEEL